MVTSVQAHPCNPATAAAAGFKVVNLPLEENGYPSLDALKAAVGPRTALVMINNPDDMGIYNPEIREWVRVAHEAGALCFYDHANFNGVMGRLSAGELGFDACMFMLHKTFGAPKAGGGPAVGAYGCTAALAPYLPGPVVDREGDRLRAGDAREVARQGPRVLGERAAGGEGLGLGAGDGGRRHPARRRPLGGGQQLHGRAARPHPRPRALAPGPRGPAHGDDALVAGAAPRGDGDRHGRGREPHGRLRHRPLVDEPRALDRAAALHARGGRAVVAARTSTSGSTCWRGSWRRRGPIPSWSAPRPHNQPVAKVDGAVFDDPDALGDDLAGVEAEGRAARRAGPSPRRASPRASRTTRPRPERAPSRPAPRCPGGPAGAGGRGRGRPRWRPSWGRPRTPPRGTARG